MPCNEELFDIEGSHPIMKESGDGRYVIGFGSISRRRRRRIQYPSTMSSDFGNTRGK